MKCDSCGSELPADARFCGECGASRAEAPPAPPPVMSFPPAPPAVMSSPPAPAPGSQPPPPPAWQPSAGFRPAPEAGKPARLGPILIILVVAVVCLCACLACLWLTWDRLMGLLAPWFWTISGS
jgi:hypothetical protein